ncbi:MAG: aminoglycoside phosphotransferase family protein [FCB group bacterium]|nr:aminoglycoside phosphotransferase family protein [FCB group bacterium]
MTGYGTAEGLEPTELLRTLESALGVAVLRVEQRAVSDDPQKRLGCNRACVVDCMTENGPRTLIIRRPLAAGTAFHDAEAIKSLFWQGRYCRGDNPRDALPALAWIDAEDCLRALPHTGTPAIIEEYVPGTVYASLLERKGGRAAMDEEDWDCANAILGLLLNRRELPDEGNVLYAQDLVCLMSKALLITDNLHRTRQLEPREKEDIEHGLLRWRQRLLNAGRLPVRSHNDFHPWNLILRPEGGVSAIDWDFPGYGERARDLGTLLPNYLYFALLKRGRFDGVCREIYRHVLNEYLCRSRDAEAADMARPFFAVACLILSHARWYPDLSGESRMLLRRLALGALDEEGPGPLDLLTCGLP